MDGNTACAERLGEDVDFRLIIPGIKKGALLGNAREFRRILRADRPDALVTYNWGSIEWAASNLWPICRHLHIEDGFGPEEACGQLRRRVWARRVLFAPRTRVVLPSQRLYRLAAETWRLPKKRLTYLPNGIDCDRFSRSPDQAISARMRRHPDELLVGTVAGLRPEKNIGRLIEAFSLVRSKQPARLIIIGDGIERARLEAMVGERGLVDDVVFTGSLTAPEQLLGAFDVFALSSDTEQMPYSILEAMAAGLSIASVDVGDIKDMVSAENRNHVVPVDARPLAAAMVDLLGDRRRRVGIGLANQRRVRSHYDQQEMFDAYGELFG